MLENIFLRIEHLKMVFRYSRYIPQISVNIFLRLQATHSYSVELQFIRINEI